MNKADANIVIAYGLVAMGVIAVVGWIALSIKTGTSSGTEIPIAIISGLGGVLTGKSLAESSKPQAPQSQVSQTLGQVAEVASQGQQIMNAVGSIKDTFKKKEEKS